MYGYNLVKKPKKNRSFTPSQIVSSSEREKQ